MLQRIWIMWLARTREFYRDTSGLAWNLLFPLLIIAGFAFAFSGDKQNTFKVGVYPPESLSDKTDFFATKHIEFIPQKNKDEAYAKVGRHQIDLLVVWGDTVQYWINPTSPKGDLVEKVLLGSTKYPVLRQEAHGKQVRYVDWLVPGILALNMMFSALFGVGYVIVRYRINGVLKRLKATPLRAYEFLVAQVLSRLVVIMGSSVVVFVGANFFIHFSMLGSWLLLLSVFALGTFCMISLGLVFAARFKSEEMVSGILNFLTWPMMFLSGVWFSLEGLHPVFQKIALAFPLTHLINASRAIMLDGAGINQVALPMLILAGMSVVFIGVGAVLFKWE